MVWHIAFSRQSRQLAKLINELIQVNSSISESVIGT